jgi:prefoldin subunit 5
MDEFIDNKLAEFIEDLEQEIADLRAEIEYLEMELNKYEKQPDNVDDFVKDHLPGWPSE